MASVTRTVTINATATVRMIEFLPDGNFAVDIQLESDDAHLLMGLIQWRSQKTDAGFRLLSSDGSVIIESIPAAFLSKLADIQSMINTYLDSEAGAGKILL